jgi:hypothetical protein
MTQLTKTIRRELPHPRRNWIVSIYPESVIGIREKGRRKEYRLSLEAVFSMAAKIAAAELHRARIEARKARRLARKGEVKYDS